MKPRLSRRVRGEAPPARRGRLGPRSHQFQRHEQPIHGRGVEQGVKVKGCSRSAGHNQDGAAGSDNEGTDILRVAGNDPVPRVGDRDHRRVDGTASASPS